MKKTANLLGVGSAETVRQWVRRVPVADAPVTGTVDPDVVRKLRREVAELTRANGILKAASAFFAAEIDRPHR